MNAQEIIREIETLPPEEQAKVVQFAYRLDAERQLNGHELAVLAGRMVAATDPAEALMVREEIMRGFYGGKPHVYYAA